MLEHGEFRERLNHYINDYDSYTKDELYRVFLELTERYLEELVSILNMKNTIIKEFGNARGNAIIEKIAVDNPAVQNLDEENSKVSNIKEIVKNLMAHIDCEFGYSIGDNGVDNPL